MIFENYNRHREPHCRPFCFKLFVPLILYRGANRIHLLDGSYLKLFSLKVWSKRRTDSLNDRWRLTGTMEMTILVTMSFSQLLVTKNIGNFRACYLKVINIISVNSSRCFHIWKMSGVKLRHFSLQELVNWHYVLWNCLEFAELSCS